MIKVLEDLRKMHTGHTYISEKGQRFRLDGLVLNLLDVPIVELTNPSNNHAERIPLTDFLNYSVLEPNQIPVLQAINRAYFGKFFLNRADEKVRFDSLKKEITDSMKVQVYNFSAGYLEQLNLVDFLSYHTNP